jgi:hypothetical protein
MAFPPGKLCVVNLYPADASTDIEIDVEIKSEIKIARDPISKVMANKMS